MSKTNDVNTKRARRLKLSAITSLSFQICTIACGFILPRVYLECFGSETYGLVSSISQFLAIVSFLDLGVGAVVQSSLYKPLAEKNSSEISAIVISAQKFFSKLAFILLGYVCILILVYPYLVNTDFDFVFTSTLIAAMCLSLFAQYYFGIVNKLLLNADQRVYVTNLIQTVALVLNTIIVCALSYAGESIQIVKLASSFVYVVRPLCLALYVRKHYRLNKKQAYEGEPIKQKWNGIAQHISAVVLDGTDTIVLTIFSSLKSVSVYTVYNLVIYGVKQLMMSVTAGVQSLMGELIAKNETEALETLFLRVEWIIHTGTVLVFGIVAVLVVPFVQVYTAGLQDTNYIEPIFAVLLTAANACHCLRLPYNLMILAAGHYKQTQSCYLIAAVVNIVLSIVCVLLFGLVGVAIGTLVAMLYQTIWMALYNAKTFVVRPLAHFFKQLTIDAVTFTSIYSLVFFISLGEVSILAWVVMAAEVSLVAFAITLVVNLFFYKDMVLKLVKEKSLLGKRG